MINAESDGWKVSSLMFVYNALPIMSSSHRNHQKGDVTYFSSSFSFATSNVSSQPTSISTLTPPSSSKSDCDALDSDCAPCNGVKVNILPDSCTWISASGRAKSNVAWYLSAETDAGVGFVDGCRRKKVETRDEDGRREIASARGGSVSYTHLRAHET